MRKLPFPDRNIDTFGLSLIYVLIMIAIIVIGMIWANQAYGEKNVTMTIEDDDEMVWCYYGDDEKPTAICNSMELEGKSKLMDGFLYFMEYGPVIDCD